MKIMPQTRLQGYLKTIVNANNSEKETVRLVTNLLIRYKMSFIPNWIMVRLFPMIPKDE